MNFINDSKYKNSLYTLDLLFDYLQLNLEPSILVSNIGHAWSEANESIRRAEALDDKDSIKITKIISLLDLFGKNFSLFSTRELIESSIDISENKLNKSLKDLEEKKIIIFRKFKNAFSYFLVQI